MLLSEAPAKRRTINDNMQ